MFAIKVNRCGGETFKGKVNSTTRKNINNHT